MLKKINGYFKEIADCEKLERRSSKEWAEKGNMDEVVKMVEFKERKERNGLIAYGLLLGGTALVGLKLHRLEREELKAEKERKYREAQRKELAAQQKYFDLIDEKDLESEEVIEAKKAYMAAAEESSAALKAALQIK